MIRTSIILLLACFLTLTTGVTAQVVSKSTEEIERKRYLRPLVLDITLEEFLDYPKGREWIVPKISAFDCEKVYIKRLTLTILRRLPNHGVAIEGDIQVVNDFGKDIDVHLIFEIRYEDRNLSRVEEDINIEVDDRDDYARFLLEPHFPSSFDPAQVTLHLILDFAKD